MYLAWGGVGVKGVGKTTSGEILGWFQVDGGIE